MGQEYENQKAILKEKHNTGQLTDRQYLAKLCLLAMKNGYLQFTQK